MGNKLGVVTSVSWVSEICGGISEALEKSQKMQCTGSKKTGSHWGVFFLGGRLHLRNKAKPLEIQYKKAYIPIFVCAKYHKFILCLSISTDHTIQQSQWTSFFAHTTFAQISWYHMTKLKISCHLTLYYIWDALSAITPQINVPSATQWNILTLLQKGKSCYQVAFQMNVSCSIITGLYSNASSTAPRQPGGYQERLTLRVNTPSLEKLCLEWSLMLLNSQNFWTWISLSRWW